ncbi:unnamed protein product [Amoebophrya sp. A25]|nr:unnamed protein product [Amoebophrya sp. A25]|eukprot:GSA25T00001212001.1
MNKTSQMEAASKAMEAMGMNIDDMFQYMLQRKMQEFGAQGPQDGSAGSAGSSMGTAMSNNMPMGTMGTISDHAGSAACASSDHHSYAASSVAGTGGRAASMASMATGLSAPHMGLAAAGAGTNAALAGAGMLGMNVGSLGGGNILNPAMMNNAMSLGMLGSAGAATGFDMSAGMMGQMPNMMAASYLQQHQQHMSSPVQHPQASPSSSSSSSRNERHFHQGGVSDGDLRKSSSPSTPWWQQGQHFDAGSFGGDTTTKAATSTDFNTPAFDRQSSWDGGNVRRQQGGGFHTGGRANQDSWRGAGQTSGSNKFGPPMNAGGALGTVNTTGGDQSGRGSESSPSLSFQPGSRPFSASHDSLMGFIDAATGTHAEAATSNSGKSGKQSGKFGKKQGGFNGRAAAGTSKNDGGKEGSKKDNKGKGKGKDGKGKDGKGKNNKGNNNKGNSKSGLVIDAEQLLSAAAQGQNTGASGEGLLRNHNAAAIREERQARKGAKQARREEAQARKGVEQSGSTTSGDQNKGATTKGAAGSGPAGVEVSASGDSATDFLLAFANNIEDILGRGVVPAKLRPKNDAAALQQGKGEKPKLNAPVRKTTDSSTTAVRKTSDASDVVPLPPQSVNNPFIDSDRASEEPSPTEVNRMDEQTKPSASVSVGVSNEIDAALEKGDAAAISNEIDATLEKGDAAAMSNDIDAALEKGDAVLPDVSECEHEPLAKRLRTASSENAAERPEMQIDCALTDATTDVATPASRASEGPSTGEQTTKAAAREGQGQVHGEDLKTSAVVPSVNKIDDPSEPVPPVSVDNCSVVEESASLVENNVESAEAVIVGSEHEDQIAEPGTASPLCEDDLLVPENALLQQSNERPKRVVLPGSSSDEELPQETNAPEVKSSDVGIKSEGVDTSPENEAGVHFTGVDGEVATALRVEIHKQAAVSPVLPTSPSGAALAKAAAQQLGTSTSSKSNPPVAVKTAVVHQVKAQSSYLETAKMEGLVVKDTTASKRSAPPPPPSASVLGASAASPPQGAAPPSSCPTLSTTGPSDYSGGKLGQPATQPAFGKIPNMNMKGNAAGAPCGLDPQGAFVGKKGNKKGQFGGMKGALDGGKGGKPRGQFYCRYCDYDCGSNEAKWRQHCKERHTQCIECGESLPENFMEAHMLTHVVDAEENDDELQKWIASRKARFPTRKRIQEKTDGTVDESKLPPMSKIEEALRDKMDPNKGKSLRPQDEDESVELCLQYEYFHRRCMRGRRCPWRHKKRLPWWMLQEDGAEAGENAMLCEEIVEPAVAESSSSGQITGGAGDTTTSTRGEAGSKTSDPAKKEEGATAAVQLEDDKDKPLSFERNVCHSMIHKKKCMKGDACPYIHTPAIVYAERAKWRAIAKQDKEWEKRRLEMANVRDQKFNGLFGMLCGEQQPASAKRPASTKEERAAKKMRVLSTTRSSVNTSEGDTEANAVEASDYEEEEQVPDAMREILRKAALIEDVTESYGLPDPVRGVRSACDINLKRRNFLQAFATTKPYVANDAGQIAAADSEAKNSSTIPSNGGAKAEFLPPPKRKDLDDARRVLEFFKSGKRVEDGDQCGNQDLLDILHNEEDEDEEWSD